MDTQIQPLGQRFLDTLTAAPGNPRAYQIGEHLWDGHRGVLVDSLHRRCLISLASMSVRPAFRANGYDWDWSFEIAPQVRLTKTGRALDVLRACEAAAGCKATFILHSYLGENLAWFSETETKWVAAIDGERASLWVCESGEFAWAREWAKGAPALALTGGDLRGRAASLDEAMRAAIDAPELFKRACGALIAVLRAPAKIGE